MGRKTRRNDSDIHSGKQKGVRKTGNLFTAHDSLPNRQMKLFELSLQDMYQIMNDNNA